MPTSGPRALLGMTYTEKPVEGRKTSESEMRFRTRPKTGVYAGGLEKAEY